MKLISFNRNVLFLYKCAYFTAEIFKRHLTQIPNFTFLQGPITNLWVSEDFLRFLWKYVIKISSSWQGRWNLGFRWGIWPLQFLVAIVTKTFIIKQHINTTGSTIFWTIRRSCDILNTVSNRYALTMSKIRTVYHSF